MPTSHLPAGPTARIRWPILPADWRGLVGGLCLAAGLIAAYWGSLSVPLLLDDGMSIADNPTIRHLWPIGQALSPPASGTTVSGRPVLNFSLAVNYAFGGTKVAGYHAVNLAIHLLAGLTLFGIVRRTLRRPVWRERYGAAELPLALAVAAIWTLHPLQTEAVTYLAQRAESLMGLFYLLTLYCFIRYADEETKIGPPSPVGLRRGGFRVAKAGGRRRFVAGWAVLSTLACLLGMATKEVMVSAPVLVFLYDRTFVAGSFGEAWRRRRRLYSGLAATWILLGYLVIAGGGNRDGSVGFGVGIAELAYGLTQFQAVAHYLRLALWPHPLVFEYGIFWVKSAGQVIPFACIVVPLAALTGVALWRWPAWGFLGFWFFAILAPTSLIPGGTQMIVEHRMYLALAAVIAPLVLGGYALVVGTSPARRSMRPGSSVAASGYFVALFAWAAGLGVLTARRNEDYRSALALWGDTVAKRPANALAHNNLGEALRQSGRKGEALEQFEEAVRLKPDYAEARSNLGAMLDAAGRTQEALAQYQESLRLAPKIAAVHYNFGLALARVGRTQEAQAQYEDALRLKPDYPEALNGLGDALQAAGRPQEALAQYEEALRLKPDYPEAHNNFAGALQALGRRPEALAQYEEAIRLKPDFSEAHNNLGAALQAAGRTKEAIAQEEEAIRLKPNYAEAHDNLGVALEAAGRTPEALAQYGEALRLKPDFPEAHFNLGNAQQTAGRIPEALEQYEAALRLRPDYAEAQSNLGYALARSGRVAEAILHYEQALRLKPDFATVHYNLALSLVAAGREQEAIAHYERALQLKPDFPEAKRELKNLLDRSKGAKANTSEAAGPAAAQPEIR